MRNFHRIVYIIPYNHCFISFIRFTIDTNLSICISVTYSWAHRGVWKGNHKGFFFILKGEFVVECVGWFSRLFVRPNFVLCPVSVICCCYIMSCMYIITNWKGDARNVYTGKKICSLKPLILNTLAIYDIHLFFGTKTKLQWYNLKG